MPYETRRGDKRTTISSRFHDDDLRALDALAAAYGRRDETTWARRMGREPYLDAAKPIPRGEAVRRAVHHALKHFPEDTD